MLLTHRTNIYFDRQSTSLRARQNLALRKYSFLFYTLRDSTVIGYEFAATIAGRVRASVHIKNFFCFFPISYGMKCGGIGVSKR